LAEHQLFATGTTGGLIEEELLDKSKSFSVEEVITNWFCFLKKIETVNIVERRSPLNIDLDVDHVRERALA
jgi:hypothetical protein